MLTSIGLGLFILGIVYVAIWSVRNDGAPSIGEQSGFIRMRVPRRPRPRGKHRAAVPAAAGQPGVEKHKAAERPIRRVGRLHYRN